MEEFLNRESGDEGDLYSLPAEDRLAVLSSTRTIVEQGEQVWINPEQVDALAQRWLNERHSASTSSSELWDTRYHFHDGSERTVNWLLLLDALNFCFWADKGQERWCIDYHGETLNGYWAEAAALKRAVEEDKLPLWDAEYLSTIDSATMAHIFRGHSTIPLLAERVIHAREVGQVLLAKYAGQFTNALAHSEQSAVQLVELLTRDFPSFQDQTTYHTHAVRFLKRAQICVADLYNAFAGEGWGAFSDLKELTIFADYKLPQVLRHYTILEYHTALAQRIDKQEQLNAGSEEEVEIRANTIWACELLRRAMQQRGYSITAAEIDQRLWLLGQQASAMQPYHRTRTVYY